MARKAAPTSTPRDDLRVVALRAALVASGAALCVAAYGQVHAFFGGGLGMAGHLFPRPATGFWWFAALFAVCVVVPTSMIERAALRRRLAGRRALLAALAAGALARPAAVVAATQVIYLRYVLAGDPAAGYSWALGWVSHELRLPARVLLGEGLALAAPVVLVTLARLHRVPLAPTLAGATAASAVGAALALSLVTRQPLRAWLVESPVFWEALAAAALLPLAYAAMDRVETATRRGGRARSTWPQAAEPPRPRG